MLELKNITKSFDGKQVLSGVSFAIEPESVFFIAGKSGAGKSVTLKILTGLLPPDSGEVWVDGQNVTHFDENEWRKVRRKFGVVFQGSALFDSLNVLENVGIRHFEEKMEKNAVIRQKVIHSLEQVGLKADILNRYPAELSGGMRKRVAVARAIIHEPAYLFYDEPTSGLDPATSDLIDELIVTVSQSRKMTTVVVSHDMVSIKRIATRVLLLDGGQAVFNGETKDFLTSNQPLAQRFLSRI